MYIRQSTRIPLSVATCTLVLVDAAIDAAFDATDDETRIGFHIGPASIRKRVNLVVGRPERTGDWVRVPVKWSADPAGGLFPTLDGHLHLEPVGPNEARLSIRALYQPPLGRVGRALDDAALHALARLTLKDFVNTERARVMETAPVAISQEG